MKTTRKFRTIVVCKWLTLLLFQICYPAVSYALTSGPSQPEVAGFAPIGTSEMVNVFTGDFSYNIPLLDIDGYPINLSYSSNVGMEDEASWVGLGWTLNPGAITRTMKGIPDDFGGDQIQKDMNLKPNKTFGLKGGFSTELVGKEKLPFPLGVSAGIGIYFNNYNGFGFEKSLSLSVNSGDKAKGPLNGGLGFSGDTNNGLSIQPSVGLNFREKKGEKMDGELGFSLGTAWNTRAGLRQVSFTSSFERNVKTVSDKRSASLSSEHNATFDVGMQTYQPSVSLPMQNSSLSGKFTMGGEITGAHASAYVRAYYSGQKLKTNTTSNPAYGYMYHEGGEPLNNAILDFNREQDAPYVYSTPVLPLANFTADIFTVSGQGIGGSFRAFRGDVGHVHDPACSSNGDGGDVGIETGFGATSHAGASFNVNWSENNSHKWSNGNSAQSAFSSRSNSMNDLFESVYFKEANEPGVDIDQSFLNSIGSYDLLTVGVGNNASTGSTANVGYANGTASLLAGSDRNIRVNRNSSFAVLTWKDVVAGYGIYKNDYGELNLLTSQIKPHHIAQITTTGDNGMKYVYAKPVMNVKQVEMTFAIGSGLLGETNQGEQPNGENLVKYKTSDRSMENNRGLDNYYSRTTTPAYAHSYLLSAVLSSDYRDSDDVSGPSAGDLGNYTKFNYWTSSTGYRWRMPMSKSLTWSESNGGYVGFANFSAGTHCDPTDDKANYIYGEKELVYLQTIESKNYIAFFTISPRTDGYGAIGENGGISTNQSQAVWQLDKIELYTKAGYNGGDAPIKTVYFEYSNELCIGALNSLGPVKGKLTLKKVWFEYQNSKKGSLSPYEFYYSPQNEGYKRLATDRWGSYKDPNGNPSSFLENTMTNAEFPFTNNDETTDVFVQNWLMTSIKLPSGGLISWVYESDDYAYVQDKRVNQMFEIVGVGTGTNIKDGSDGPVEFDKFSRFYFKMGDDIPISEYLSNLSGPLYMKCYTNVRPGKFSPPSNGFDYIPLYIQGYNHGVIDVGSGGNGDLEQGRYGWIECSPVPSGDNSNSYEMHPLALATIQYGRSSAPNVVNDGLGANLIGEGSSLGVQLVNELLQFIVENNLKDIFMNANRSRLQAGSGKYIVPGKSYIRLSPPSKSKKGGGVRVSQITLNDQWGLMSGNNIENGVYGQVYSYSLEDGSTSGVASYEPMLGGDENPFKTHLSVSQEIRMAPDEKRMLQTPIGESFYPNPTVGYSRVEIRNYVPPGVNLTRHATGKVVQEFYTAKDFPTRVAYGPLIPVPDKTNTSGISSLLKFKVRDNLALSQGFLIELNDMHGKQRAQYVYKEGNSSPISSVIYKYRTTIINGKNELSNNVTVIFPDGTISEELMGVHMDVISDSREMNSKSSGSGGNGNLDLIPFPFPATPLPSLWPSFSEEKTRFQSFTITKVVQRFGIVEETIVTDNTSTISTKNIAYDAITGNTLVTETKNGFDDNVYSLTIPAHWHYDLMGLEQRNVGFRTVVTCNSEGWATVNSPINPFVEGDKVMVEGLINPDKSVWVTETTGNQIRLLLKNGAPIVGEKEIEIIESGRTNQASAPISEIKMLENPLVGFSANVFDRVIQASAIEYKGNWEVDCNCFSGDNVNLTSSNPFVLGIKGNWRPFRSYTYLTERDQSYANNNTNIKKDGVFIGFNPFYFNENEQWKVSRRNWTFASEITNYSHNGQEQENRDALGRLASAHIGYNSTLPVAVAANTSYFQMGFAHFEDYDQTLGPMDCRDRFPFKGGAVINGKSHSGQKSIRVIPGDKVYYSGKEWEACHSTYCSYTVAFRSTPYCGIGCGTHWEVEIINAQLPIIVEEYQWLGEYGGCVPNVEVVGNVVIVNCWNGHVNGVLTIIDQNGCRQVIELNYQL